jgi:hypothetical protein
MSKIKEAWDWLKLYGTQQQKELFRPVYQYIQTLEKRVAVLEKMHDRHMAPQMFDKKTDGQLRIEMQIENTRKTIEASGEWKATPLKQRLKMMIEEGLVGSKEWELTLKYNRLTEEKAREIADAE